jgi:hypothetical protein
MENQKKAEWILRIAIFGEFLGHGIFAILGKESFAALLTAMTGIAGSTAISLLFVIGIADIAIAILALVYPFRLMLIYASVWGFLTALARPVAGEPIWDFIERWANWGAPLALLFLRGLPNNIKGLFK